MKRQRDWRLQLLAVLLGLLPLPLAAMGFKLDFRSSWFFFPAFADQAPAPAAWLEGHWSACDPQKAGGAFNVHIRAGAKAGELLATLPAEMSRLRSDFAARLYRSGGGDFLQFRPASHGDGDEFLFLPLYTYLAAERGKDRLYLRLPGLELAQRLRDGKAKTEYVANDEGYLILERKPARLQQLLDDALAATDKEARLELCRRPGPQ